MRPNKSKTGGKGLWKGELNADSWKVGGPQDQYFQRLVDEGKLTARTNWSYIKVDLMPESHQILGGFHLDTIQSKLKNLKKKLRQAEETEKTLKGTSATPAV